METLNAFQLTIGERARVGREVRFTTQGVAVAGTLDEAYKISGGDMPWTHLIVDDTDHCVDDLTLVEVA